jgi:hypothetical protein
MERWRVTFTCADGTHITIDEQDLDLAENDTWFRKRCGNNGKWNLICNAAGVRLQALIGQRMGAPSGVQVRVKNGRTFWLVRENITWDTATIRRRPKRSDFIPLADISSTEAIVRLTRKLKGHK